MSYWGQATPEYSDIASQALVLLLSGEDAITAKHSLEEVILYERESEILNKLDCQVDVFSIYAMDVETISDMCMELCCELDAELKRCIHPAYIMQIKQMLIDPLAYIHVCAFDANTLKIEVREYAIHQ